MKKILAIILALCAVLCVCSACNTETEKTEIKVKVTFKNEGKNMFDPMEITMEKSEDVIPTVLDAALNVLDANEIQYTTGELADHTIFTEIDGVKETDDKFWQVMINEEYPKARMDSCGINDGDDIIILFDVDPEAETTVIETTAKVYETAADDYQ